LLIIFFLRCRRFSFADAAGCRFFILIDFLDEMPSLLLIISLRNIFSPSFRWRFFFSRNDDDIAS